MTGTSLHTSWLRRLFSLGAFLVPVLLVLADCSNAPKFNEGAGGAYATAGPVKIINAFVLGPKRHGTVTLGSSVSFFLSLHNGSHEADKLVSVTAPGTANSVEIYGGSVRLPPHGTVYLTGPQPAIALRGLTRTLSGGKLVRIVLRFQDSGSVAIQAPVATRDHHYATFSPPPPPGASPSGLGRRTPPAVVTPSP